ncbi:MAG: hypothetical protein ACKO34_07715 [Vampirovibrionales bacterium]
MSNTLASITLLNQTFPALRGLSYWNPYSTQGIQTPIPLNNTQLLTAAYSIRLAEYTQALGWNQGQTYSVNPQNLTGIGDLSPQAQQVYRFNAVTQQTEVLTQTQLDERLAYWLTAPFETLDLNRFTEFYPSTHGRLLSTGELPSITDLNWSVSNRIQGRLDRIDTSPAQWASLFAGLTDGDTLVLESLGLVYQFYGTGPTITQDANGNAVLENTLTGGLTYVGTTTNSLTSINSASNPTRILDDLPLDNTGIAQALNAEPSLTLRREDEASPLLLLDEAFLSLPETPLEATSESTTEALTPEALAGNPTPATPLVPFSPLVSPVTEAETSQPLSPASSATFSLPSPATPLGEDSSSAASLFQRSTLPSPIKTSSSAAFNPYQHWLDVRLVPAKITPTYEGWEPTRYPNNRTSGNQSQQELLLDLQLHNESDSLEKETQQQRNPQIRHSMHDRLRDYTR